MLTNPDQGPRNVRVRVRPCLADLERYTQRKLMTGGLGDDKSVGGVVVLFFCELLPRL